MLSIIREMHRLASNAYRCFLLYREVKELFKGSLFRSNWDTSVKCMVNLKSNFQQYFGFLVAHLSDDGAIISDTGDQRTTTKQLFLYCCESGMYMYDGDDAVIKYV